MRIRKKNVIKLGLILLFIIIVVVLVRLPRNYEKTYEVDGIEINETYNKEMRFYSFKVKVQDEVFTFNKVSKYLNKKSLVKNVSTFQNENDVCVLLEGKKLEFYPVCKNDSEYVDISFLEGTEDFYKREKVDALKREFENLKINALMDKNILVWDHKGYYFISGDEIKKLEFLENESYYNNLAYQVGEYVLTPIYDLEHNFNKFSLINMKTGKITEWEIEEEISYNSYYLGEVDGEAYLFDRKSQKEWVINPRKKTIEEVTKDGKANVWNNGWEEISTKKLASSDYIFNKSEVFSYDIKEKGLYLKLYDFEKQVKISSREPEKIVKSNDEEVYYLEKDTLYGYSLKYGEVSMITYSEWEFNNVNSIFIY